MISVEEARKLIEDSCSVLPKEEVLIAASLGCVTAEDIFSPISLPPFRNAAMDGFVLSSGRTLKASAGHPVFFKIRGEIKAGGAVSGPLKPFKTKRIMTGAPVPAGADTVLEKEKAVLKDGNLVIEEPLSPGRHIRHAGEELKKGELALGARTLMNPGTIGFLAAMGIARVPVFKKPKVSLMATGSELVCAGIPLREGKIYDSNSVMLEAALWDMRLRPILVRRVRDKPALMRTLLNYALLESDVVILTGGVSVGEHDHVKPLLADAGVETIFWKVKQKPGKPLYFGRKGRKLVFGLPGNPASVFTCFYEYVYPALRLLMGHRNPYLAQQVTNLKAIVKPDPKMNLFMKGRIDKGSAVPLQRQQSHMLSSLSETNAFLVIPGSLDTLKDGDAILAHTLPYESGVES